MLRNFFKTAGRNILKHKAYAKRDWGSKVLGTNIGGILQLIYKEFLWLLLIGFALAVPISFYFIQQWLENFTFHTSIDLLTYSMSFALVLIVVTLTISYHELKASLANPVLSLRCE